MKFYLVEARDLGQRITRLKKLLSKIPVVGKRLPKGDAALNRRWAKRHKVNRMSLIAMKFSGSRNPDAKKVYNPAIRLHKDKAKHYTKLAKVYQAAKKAKGN